MPDAPVAAPAAPAAPVTAPPAAPAAPAAPSTPAADQGGDPFAAEIDSLATGVDTLPVRRDNKGKFQPKAGEPAKVTDPKAGEPKPGEAPKAPDGQPKPGEPPKPVKAAELRAAYDASKARVKELEPQVASLSAKVKELEARAPGDVKQSPEYVALTKEVNELREEIRFVNYTKHPEFTEKYAQPYINAWHKAIGEVSQLRITITPEHVGDDGVTIPAVTRPATGKDLEAIANAPLDQIDDLAEKWFGRSAARVLRHAEKLRELAEARETALEDAKKAGVEREKTTASQSKALEGQLLKAYQDTETSLKTKYPDRFAPVEGDAEGNALLARADEWVEATFKNDSKLPQEERAKRLAAIKLHAKALPRTLKRLANAKARITELEAELAEYEKSGDPGAAGSPGAPSGNGEADDFAEIDKLATAGAR